MKEEGRDVESSCRSSFRGVGMVPEITCIDGEAIEAVDS